MHSLSLKELQKERDHIEEKIESAKSNLQWVKIIPGTHVCHIINKLEGVVQGFIKRKNEINRILSMPKKEIVHSEANLKATKHIFQKEDN